MPTRLFSWRNQIGVVPALRNTKYYCVMWARKERAARGQVQKHTHPRLCASKYQSDGESDGAMWSKAGGKKLDQPERFNSLSTAVKVKVAPSLERSRFFTS